MSEDWNHIDIGKPPDHALVVYYVPFARYIWGCGMDYTQIRCEYPACTHWKVITHEPKSEVIKQDQVLS